MADNNFALDAILEALLCNHEAALRLGMDHGTIVKFLGQRRDQVYKEIGQTEATNKAANGASDEDKRSNFAHTPAVPPRSNGWYIPPARSAASYRFY